MLSQFVRFATAAATRNCAWRGAARPGARRRSAIQAQGAQPAASVEMNAADVLVRP